MGLLTWWRKPALKIQDPENSRRGNRDSWSGHDVGPDDALKLSAWWSCVRLTSETVGAFPCAVFEKVTADDRVARNDHWLYTLVHESPNAEQTAAQFWESVV